MFDGVFEASGFPPARPARPATIDACAMLPALRAQGSQMTVEGLAFMLGLNAIGEARAAALDPETPRARFGETLGLLADAIVRHQALTGRDALAVARAALVDHFDEGFADHVLAPLEASRMDIAITALIAAPEPGDPRQPTLGERQEAAGAVLGLAWADPRLGSLAQALDGFYIAHQADGAGAPGMVTRAAMASVGAALQAAADRGVTQGELQVTLNAWALVTGAPRIEVDGVAPV
jgi:hypothetical protein